MKRPAMNHELFSYKNCNIYLAAFSLSKNNVSFVYLFDNFLYSVVLNKINNTTGSDYSSSTSRGFVGLVVNIKIKV